MAQFLWYNYTFKTKIPSLWPWPLTYEGQFILVNGVQPYKYPV